MFSPAFGRAVTVANAQGAFRGSGIFPVNVNAIPDHAYDPSNTTERPLQPEVGDHSSSMGPNTGVSSSAVSNQDGQSAPTRYESLPAVNGSSSSTEKNAVPGTNNESQPAVDDPLSSAELSTGPAWSAEQSASTSVPAPLVDFNQLLPVPHRQRPPTAKRCRKKPPTPELTSDETLKFVTDSVNKSNSVSLCFKIRNPEKKSKI